MRILIAGVLAMVLAACSPINPAAAPAGMKTAWITISRFPDHKTLARVALTSDKQFSLSFIHSVSKTRVTDIYAVKGDQILQTREIFLAHGAGLPSSPEEPQGISWEERDGQFILNMERPIPKLVVRTDKNYENRLMVKDDTVNLNQWEDQALLLTIDIAGEK